MPEWGDVCRRTEVTVAARTHHVHYFLVRLRISRSIRATFGAENLPPICHRSAPLRGDANDARRFLITKTLRDCQVYDFTTALLFSIETQQTIGFGSRRTNPDCPEAILVMMCQSCFGVIIQVCLSVCLVSFLHSVATRQFFFSHVILCVSFSLITTCVRRTQAVITLRHEAVC